MCIRRWLLSCLLLIPVLNQALAAEFTADLVIAEGKVVKTGSIQVRGDLYRMEIDDPRGPGIVVQMIPDLDLCRVLVPRYSLYMDVPRSEGIVQMFDPFMAAESMLEHFTRVIEGTEVIAGVSCIKEAFKYDDDVVLYRWMAEELAFPLKILLVGQEGYYTELGNIELQDVAAELFTLPDGFRESDWAAILERFAGDPQMRAREEAWTASQPREMTLSALLAEGDEFRVLAGQEVSIEVAAKEMGDSVFSWSVAAMKGNEALPLRTMTGPGKIAFAAESGVDQTILRAVKNEFWGEISLSGPGTPVLATKTVVQRDSGGGIGQTLPAELTSFSLRVRSLEAPGESILPVRIDLTLEQSREGAAEDEVIKHRLEPGEEMTFEKAGSGAVAGYALSLVAPGGRAEVELTIDYRPPQEQGPF